MKKTSPASDKTLDQAVADPKIVTVVNQTGRPLVLNLAPISDESLHLPARGRLNIMEDELQATEVQGALNANPPRLIVIQTPTQQDATAPN